MKRKWIKKRTVHSTIRQGGTFHIRLLIDTFFLSVYWNEEEIGKQNFYLRKAIRDRRNHLRMQHEDLFPRLFIEYPQFFQRRENFSWERYLWASTVIISRTFEFDVEGAEVVMLIPFADLMNHRQSPLEPDVAVEWNNEIGAVQVSDVIQHVHW
jgi:hypothetical protein